ncbi:glycosyltransferase [Haladaptatus sp. DYSN1]|uniref:glycosyltransferase n=1 Tax=unclassified Haladaptatus TaxID=2622732 RepID=UPI002406ED43|nr:glycosyltransferase [Haladaptatus sp. DYSN1]
MKALQLVTTPRPFFDQQVEGLESRGVAAPVHPIPRPETGGRGPREFAEYVPEVLRASLSGADVVHANFGLTAPFALAQPRRPVVLTFWGTDLMGPTWLQKLSEQCARRADAVVVPSKTLAKRLDVDHNVIPFGVDTDLFRPIDRAEAREQLGWDADETVALFPYDTERDVKDYSRAKRVVDATEGDVTLRPISGVDYDEMPYYFNASDLLLVTSKRESGPMVVKEAAACNVPVVSTDVGFARDVLEPVANSTVADTDDELVAGIQQVAESGDRSDGRETIDCLSIDEMTDRLLSVYHDVTCPMAGVRHG